MSEKELEIQNKKIEQLDELIKLNKSMLSLLVLTTKLILFEAKRNEIIHSQPYEDAMDIIALATEYRTN